MRHLRKAGEVSLQVLMMTPATGSRLYQEAFTSGLAYDSVDGRRVEPAHARRQLRGRLRAPAAVPGCKQLNIMVAYLYFYNPLRFLWALVRPCTRLYFADSIMQGIGMWGTTQTNPSDHRLGGEAGCAARSSAGASRRNRVPMRAPTADRPAMRSQKPTNPPMPPAPSPSRSEPAHVSPTRSLPVRLSLHHRGVRLP